MPMYVYTCDCGRTVEEFRHMSESTDPPPVCESCQKPMGRDFSRQRVNTPMQAFSKPIEMYSCAPETPEQLSAMRTACPDVEFNDLLVPLAHSRKEKLDILKSVDFEEKG